jgi:hypothetical protein
LYFRVTPGIFPVPPVSGRYGDNNQVPLGSPTLVEGPECGDWKNLCRGILRDGDPREAQQKESPEQWSHNVLPFTGG